MYIAREGLDQIVMKLKLLAHSRHLVYCFGAAVRIDIIRLNY